MDTSWVTEEMLDAVMQVESSGGTNMTGGGKGAVGPYQFLPQNVHNMGYGVKKGFDPMDPVESRAAAKQYLIGMQKKHGFTPAQTLQAYNWGPTKMAKYIKDGGASNPNNFIPEETTNYLTKISAAGGNLNPSMLDSIASWGDEVWDSFFDAENGDEAIKQVKQSAGNPFQLMHNTQNPNKGSLGDMKYNGPEDEGLGTVTMVPALKGLSMLPRLGALAAKYGDDVAESVQGWIKRNSSQLNRMTKQEYEAAVAQAAGRFKPKPALLPKPTAVVPKPIIPKPNQIVPRDMTRQGPVINTIQAKPFIGPAVPAIAAVTNTTLPPPQVYPQPFSENPNTMGVPVAPIAANAANAANQPFSEDPNTMGVAPVATAPQRPGYKVVTSSNGNPVKAGGGGYVWSKDYQHPIWENK